jgi:hypothetical protein
LRDPDHTGRASARESTSNLVPTSRITGVYTAFARNSNVVIKIDFGIICVHRVPPVHVGAIHARRDTSKTKPQPVERQSTNTNDPLIKEADSHCKDYQTKRTLSSIASTTAPRPSSSTPTLQIPRPQSDVFRILEVTRRLDHSAVRPECNQYGIVKRITHNPAVNVQGLSPDAEAYEPEHHGDNSHAEAVLC